MTRDNRLRSDAVNLAVRLPAEDLGSVGCRLARVTVDPKVGPEVVLLFTETPEDARYYATAGSVRLLSNTAMVPTPEGTIGAIVWQIGATLIEQYLNPGTAGTRTLLGEAAEQSHLKLVILDNRTSNVVNLVEYPNMFELDGLATAMTAKVDEAPTDFAKAVQHAKAHAGLIAKVRALS
jgi:hypothetical protein